ncbi:MAG: MAPEG family protein [Nevskiales bacterium]
MSASICVLLGFTAWTIALISIVLFYRTGLVLARKTPANSWTRGAQTWQDPGLITRMAHAHLNCLENLPLVAAVILSAQVMEQGAVTDGLACVLLGLRIAQSTVHMIAVNHWMVFLRATLYTGQIAILAYWVLKLGGLV